MNGTQKEITFLVEALSLTLKPSNENFKKAEEMLSQARQQKDFFTWLLKIIDQTNIAVSIRLAASCCLAKDIREFLGKGDKNIDPSLINKVFLYFKENIFRIISCNFENNPIRKKLEEAAKLLIQNIFPNYWPNLIDILIKVMNDSNNLQDVYSVTKGVYFTLNKYKNLMEDKKEDFPAICKQTLPSIQKLAENIFKKVYLLLGTDMDNIEIYIEIINVILKCFKIVNHLNIEMSKVL